LISPLAWAQHPAMSRGSCTLLACDFTYLTSNANFAINCLSAVKLTRTMLAAPPKTSSMGSSCL
jgi:enoyl-CoA hydratase/carnithine racemase